MFLGCHNKFWDPNKQTRNGYFEVLSHEHGATRKLLTFESKDKWMNQTLNMHKYINYPWARKGKCGVK